MCKFVGNRQNQKQLQKSKVRKKYISIHTLSDIIT